MVWTNTISLLSSAILGVLISYFFSTTLGINIHMENYIIIGGIIICLIVIIIAQYYELYNNKKQIINEIKYEIENPPKPKTIFRTEKLILRLLTNRYSRKKIEECYNNPIFIRDTFRGEMVITTRDRYENREQILEKAKWNKYERY